MELWSFYFFAKLFLHYKEYIKFDVLWNLAFALFLIIPLSPKFRFRRAVLTVKALVAFVAAVALLWHDTWFPPPWEAASMLQAQGIPSREYILNFLGRFYNPDAFMVLGGLFAVTYLASKFLRMTTLVLMVLIALAPLRVFGQPDGQGIGASVDAFFDAEDMRRVHFKKPVAGAPDFDVVVLHICSLAWDDLKAAKMENNPLWGQFDLLFTSFNTVTSYSGPALIRLMKANCGQPRHENLYSESPPECYLFPTLERMGFTTQAILNHDGVYGNFAGEMASFAKVHGQPMDAKGVPTPQRMFDNTPIHDDYQTLLRWWTHRLASDDPAVALYYNTVSLHDGSHWADEPEWWKRAQDAQYKEFLSKLLQDLSRFLKTLEDSGRKVVVIFVPEHGRAVRGSAIQPAGLRDIPLPPITLAPMGIKIIGKERGGAPFRQKVVEKPVSHFAIAHTLAQFLEKSPYGEEGAWPSRAFMEGIPQTDFLAENQSAIVVRVEGKLYYFGKEKRWMEVAGRELE
ncbi:MAG: cellulose biosynthesis protein BcsG [Nitrospinae bacterium]|nr:cellulose biosynthesis protein BcsG [Nitrospinota bacterium]